VTIQSIVRLLGSRALRFGQHTVIDADSRDRAAAVETDTSRR
jgi:hypothetical protein